MPASPKPAKGTARKAKAKRRRRVVTREQTIMRQARVRDRSRCQAVMSSGVCWGLVDVCHRRHRGMGGNPKGDRTVLADLICLCRHHHQMLDSGRLHWEDIR